MKIKKLPDIVARQIAAGEVIERPVSIIKELVENSLDAGADKIIIKIYNGGKDKIIIKDNGSGIHKLDLELAITQHATSKIFKTEDLEAVNTFGFRGEALASIAAVSRLEIHSYYKDNLHNITDNEDMYAWELNNKLNRNNILISNKLSSPGTLIIVQDLFYNMPVRKNFLRSDRTEYLQIENYIKQLALSNFKLEIEFYHNDKLKYQLFPAIDELDIDLRLKKICGNKFLQNSKKISLDYSGYNLFGWVQKNNLTNLSIASEIQYFFVNSRIVKDKILRHGLQANLNLGEQINAVIYLNFDPCKVDVNVHPTKQEVKFHESRIVHDLLSNSILAAYPENKKKIIEPNNLDPVRSSVNVPIGQSNNIDLLANLSLESNTDLVNGINFDKAISTELDLNHNLHYKKYTANYNIFSKILYNKFDASNGKIKTMLVYSNKIIALGDNTVLGKYDPTGHSLINLIRYAAKKLRPQDFSKSQVYILNKEINKLCDFCVAGLNLVNITKIYYV